MSKSRFGLISGLLLVHNIICLQAQETIPAAGGNASSDGGNLSYSIGQIVYANYSGTNGSILLGVQQPYEISNLIAIEEVEGISLLYSVSPNPVTDFLTLKIENYIIEGLSYQLFDLSGRLLESKKIDNDITNIYMIDLIQATYFLRIMEVQKEVKTFKIIKN